MLTPQDSKPFAKKVMQCIAPKRMSILILALGLLVSASAIAQPVSLTIKDKQVYINGKQLPENAYPESLASEGLNLKFYFEANDTPSFNLDGQDYVIESDRIRAVTAPATTSSRTTVIYRNQSPPPAEGRAGNPELREESETVHYEYHVSTDPVSNVMQQYVTEIGAQAQQLQGMREVSNNRDASNILEQLLMQTEEAQQIARNMADMQFQQYLNMVQQQDKELYERLVHEYNLENQTLQLAQKARQTTDEEERKVIIDQLADMLDEIFELKQQNRREEIIQLENQLELLQNRLQQREDMREEIIRRRISDLVGN